MALLAALAWPATSWADYADLYRAGLRSFELGYYREALVFFEAAAQEQPRSDRSVREYGMWRAPYLPYYQQGRALHRLGRYASALRALEESENQGAISSRKARKHYKRLLALRKEIRQKIDQEVQHLYRGAAADYETVDELRRSPVIADSTLGRNLPAFEAIGASLRRTTAHLEDASLYAAASELETAMGLLDQARDGIAEMAVAIESKEREIRDQQARRARQQRREAALRDYRQAEELLADGGCSASAIELLESLDTASLSADDATPTPEPDLLLALAHIRCDHFALAEIYLERASAEPSPSRLRVRRLLQERRPQVDFAAPEEQQPTEQAGGDDRIRREEALSDYLVASARSELDGCRAEEISELIASARRTLEPETDPPEPAHSRGSAIPIPYQPDLALARAYSHCRDRDGVERHLELAEGHGEASQADLEELEAWLARHPKLQPYSGSFALLAGAYDYSAADGWPSLYKPGEDIREVRAILERHGFEVELLENPTGEQLEEALDTFYLEHGGEAGHRLVFYYAGHGHTEVTLHGVKLGYLVPVDAGDPKRDRTFLQDLFGMERFREYAIRSNANDLLFMFDSCFAGTVFKATLSCVPPDCAPLDKSSVTLPELVARPVRMFMTAGDEKERVPDQSLFRQMITRALAGEADSDTDGFILGRELGTFVQTSVVARQRADAARYKTASLGGRDLAEPKWGTLIEGNFGRGDLLFHVPEDARRAAAATPPASELSDATEIELIYWAAARGSGEPADYLRYLERFPKGHFVALAGWILDRLAPEG